MLYREIRSIEHGEETEREYKDKYKNEAEREQ